MCAKLSTSNIPTGGGVQKTLQPGNTIIQIESISLKAVKIKGKEGSYDIILKAEGEPVGDTFEGFYKDKDDPSKGRYLGQVGTIRATEWFFSDGETKGGVKVSRDNEIMKWVQNVCKVLGAKSWVSEQDGLHDTIEEFMLAFIKSKLLKDKWFTVCLCGKEYVNRENYTNYDLFLPKFTTKNDPIALKNGPQDRLTQFDPVYHIKKLKKPEQVEGFDGGSKRKSTGKNDFSI